MKIRTLTLLSLAAVGLCACKPTERTALKKKQAEQQTVQVQELLTPPSVPTATPPEAPEVVEVPPPAPVPVPEPANTLMVVSTTQQSYNPLRPWQKDSPRQSRALGVYLGDGKVLTIGRVVNSATYVELMLPDVSRVVTAKVLRFDEEMNLALLTVAHEEDASIFESRTALPLGEALNRGDKATFAALINGVEPVHVALHAENVGGDKVPLMVMRAERPLPDGQTTGSPVVRDGQLCALGLSYRKQEQLMQVINAELIQRFLTQEKAGVPVLGVELTPLDDPLFRKYLKLDASANGLYIRKVLPGSAADAAGVKVGDVLTAVDGLPLDNQGRCDHPRYGLHQAAVLLRGMKDAGQELPITVSRAGESIVLSVELNCDAVEKALFRPQENGVQPRYVMWGGLLFQPLTSTLMSEIRNRSNGLLPVELQMLEQDEAQLRKAGCTEPVALTFVLPTEATQGYDGLRLCHLQAVNGKPVNSFAELPALLDETTENGLIRLDFNKAPYTVYVDRAAVDTVNSQLQQGAIPQLRVVE